MNETTYDKVQQVLPRKASSSLTRYLDDPFFELDDVSLSRRQLTEITGLPCLRAVSQLQRTCRKFSVRSLRQLHATGLAALQRCAGVGERVSLMAAMILYVEGYDLKSWTGRPNVSLRTAIHLVHNRARRHKKPA